MEEKIVKLTDENGNEDEFTILDYVQIEDREFLVTQTMMDGEMTAVILEVLEDDDGSMMYKVPERDVCEAVIDVFIEEHDEEYTQEPEDEDWG